GRIKDFKTRKACLVLFLQMLGFPQGLIRYVVLKEAAVEETQSIDRADSLDLFFVIYHFRIEQIQLKTVGNTFGTNPSSNFIVNLSFLGVVFCNYRFDIFK